jgi:MarR family transcriptional regulator for hemolysin
MSDKAKAILCDADIHDIEYLICHVNSLWRRFLNSKIKNLGISGTEKRVLFCVARNPGMTQVQIAKLLELEPQNLVRILDRLSEEEWIEKKANPGDRRVKCVSVTAKAEVIIAKIKSIGSNAKAEILAGIHNQDAKVLMASLGFLRTNLLAQLDDSEEEKI